MERRHADVTRRHFMQGGVSAALGLSLGRTVGAAPRRARVVLIRDEQALVGQAARADVVARMLGDVVARVTGKATPADGWRSLVKPQDIVGLVATDHLNATHPELVAAARQAVQAAGVPADRVRMAQGGPQQAAACTALVALPALKAHWLTGIGTVLKNYITFSGRPASYHGADNVKLGEVWLQPQVQGKTRLIVVDALRPLCDKGPQPDPRYMWPYRGLLAGTDPVAVETVCLRIITEKRQALRGEPWPLSPPPLCVEAADRAYGLGTSVWAEITIDRAGWLVDALV